jgi:DNA invertase Pin-like site-specific DNA recombinase
MKPAIYIRTSTADQDGQAQLYALHRAAKARGWSNAKEFIDVGFSGASRPALDRLKKAVRAGEVDVIAVFALDRLSRSLRDLLFLLDEINAAGCAVVSLRENLDLTTPSGRLMLHVLGALAEFERAIITDRVKSGIARVKATGRTRSGKPIGRPRRQVDVDAVEQLLAQGKTWREIAQTLRIPRRTLVRTFGAEHKPHAA